MIKFKSRKAFKTLRDFLKFPLGAVGESRTPTLLLASAPQADVSTNSTTTAFDKSLRWKTKMEGSLDLDHVKSTRYIQASITNLPQSCPFFIRYSDQTGPLFAHTPSTAKAPSMQQEFLQSARRAILLEHIKSRDFRF